MEAVIHTTFKDLAPMITRKRLVLEGLMKRQFTNPEINKYMIQLSSVMNMTIVTNPVFSYDKDYGTSAYMCWKESGMHVYTWKKNDDRPDFISIDIYTCKDFNIEDVLECTVTTFKDLFLELTWRE